LRLKNRKSLQKTEKAYRKPKKADGKTEKALMQGVMK